MEISLPSEGIGVDVVNEVFHLFVFDLAESIVLLLLLELEVRDLGVLILKYLFGSLKGGGFMLESIEA